MYGFNSRINIKSASEIAIMREAGRLNRQTLEAVKAAIAPGVTTGELNEWQKAFSASTVFILRSKTMTPAMVCLSLAAFAPALMKYWCTVFQATANLWKAISFQWIVGLSIKALLATPLTIGVGEISRKAQHLIDVTAKALEIATALMVPDNHSGDVGAAVEEYVNSEGYYCTHTYTGHGVGREMHEDPQLPNYGQRGTGFLLREGMTIAIEPMVLVGTRQTRVLDDQWTVVSRNGGLTAHQENTIAVTKDGPFVLTSL